MHTTLILLTVLSAVLRVSAVCPDGWVGVGWNQMCTPGGDEDDCTGQFGTIYANDCDYIAMTDVGDGDWCDNSGYSDYDVSVACVGGADSQPYFITTSGGNFGNCQAASNEDNSACDLPSINNAIYWCCGPS